MPAIDFPAAPAVNDEYSFEGRTWRWNGTGWEVKEYPAALLAGTAANPSLYFSGSPTTGLYSPGADQVAISTGGVQRATVDSSGRLLVGTSTSTSLAGLAGLAQVESATAATAGLSAWCDNETAGFGSYLALGRSRGSTVGSNTAVQNNDDLGRIYFFGANGADRSNWAAEILCSVDGTPFSGGDTTDLPGRLVFSTTADGAASPTERLRITSTGNVGIGTSSPAELLDLDGDGDSYLRWERDSGAGSYSGVTSGGVLRIGPYFSATDRELALFTDNANKSWITTGTSEPLVFGINKTERARITPEGNVGIGTSSPQGKLTVIGDSATAGSGNINISNAAFPTSGWAFRIPDSSSVIDLSLDGAIAGTWRSVMYFARGTGNVGIGTSSPSAKLHVAAGSDNIFANLTSSNADPFLRLQNTSAAGKDWIIYSSGTGSGVPGAFRLFNNTDSISALTVESSGTTTLTSAAATAPFIAKISTTEVARIDSSGRLLVGTTTTVNSNALLKVQGVAGIPTSEGQIQIANGKATPVNNETLGVVTLADNNGGYGAYIGAARDGGTWTSGTSHPARIFFWTTADGAASPTERMRITSTGNVGIGTTSPATATGAGVVSLDVNGPIVVRGLLANHQTNAGVVQYGSDVTYIRSYGATTGTGQIAFRTGGGGGSPDTEVARIDSSGRLLVGTSSPAYNTLTKTIELHSAGNGINQPFYIVSAYTGTTAIECGYYELYRSRGTSVGTNTIVANGDRLGLIGFGGANGSGYDRAASIYGEVDGTPGASNDMPGRLVFATTADGAASPTERMRIDSTGFISIGGDTDTGFSNPSANNLAFSTGASERARIDSSGRLLVGANTAFNAGSRAQYALLQMKTSTIGTYGVLALGRNEAATSITVDEEIGAITFSDSNGGEFATIHAFADATAGSADYPGRLVFSVTADSASNVTEAMRINNQRELLIGTTTRTANGGVLQISNGITFPGTQSACSDANTLDDYEEGTWTPTQGTFDTWTSPTFTATYTKIGRVVHINLQQTGGTIGWSASDGIGGLPFTPAGYSTGYATDDVPSSDNGPILVYTNSIIYFQQANASETSLVLSVSYRV